MAMDRNMNEKNSQGSLGGAVSSAASSATSALSNLEMQQRLDDLKAEVAAISKTLSAIGGQTINDYSARIEKLATDAVNASSRALSSAKSEVMSMEESLESQVRANPLRSIAMAVGAGFILALMTRRS